MTCVWLVYITASKDCHITLAECYLIVNRIKCVIVIIICIELNKCDSVDSCMCIRHPITLHVTTASVYLVDVQYYTRKTELGVVSAGCVIDRGMCHFFSYFSLIPLSYTWSFHTISLHSQGQFVDLLRYLKNVIQANALANRASFQGRTENEIGHCFSLYIPMYVEGSKGWPAETRSPWTTLGLSHSIPHRTDTVYLSD